jgi:hypothetical protein
VPQPPQAAQPAYYPAPAAASKGKIGALGWILITLGTLFVLGMICVAIFVGFLHHLVTHPEATLAHIITAANPDAEVLNTDSDAHTMRIRDRKTGEEVTLSFDDIKNGKFRMNTVDREGKVANVEIGGGAGKLPSWVPAYPGATAQGNFTARGEGANGMGEGGIVSFTTSDSVAQVMSFYQDKCKEMGLAVTLTQNTPEGAMFNAADKDTHRNITVIVSSAHGENKTTIAVTYGRER